MRIAVDTARPLAAQPETGHNRWHPDIRALATVLPGDEITISSAARRSRPTSTGWISASDIR